jgi:hypothetical protein
MGKTDYNNWEGKKITLIVYGYYREKISLEKNTKQTNLPVDGKTQRLKKYVKTIYRSRILVYGNLEDMTFVIRILKGSI